MSQHPASPNLPPPTSTSRDRFILICTSLFALSFSFVVLLAPVSLVVNAIIGTEPVNAFFFHGMRALLLLTLISALPLALEKYRWDYVGYLILSVLLLLCSFWVEHARGTRVAEEVLIYATIGMLGLVGFAQAHLLIHATSGVLRLLLRLVLVLIVVLAMLLILHSALPQFLPEILIRTITLHHSSLSEGLKMLSIGLCVVLWLWRKSSPQHSEVRTG